MDKLAFPTVRVVIADDSPLLREVLADVLKANNIETVALAGDGREAIAAVKRCKPDILILDCEMPVLNGLEALKIIMKECPLPVFIFSSLTREGGAVTIKALELGAVDFLPKPLGGAVSLDAVTVELVEKIRLIVAKSRFGAYKEKVRRVDTRSPMAVSSVSSHETDIVAIGSSTGGVQAAGAILPQLPADMKPIVWVQHMPPNFTRSFAERLDTLSKMRVHEAADGDVIEHGHCYIAPGGMQMRVVKIGGKYRLKIGGTDKFSGHCPSCNVLFESVAAICGRNAVGVILTGMGDDGAQGLSSMHDKGAYVIGENERSCVVYGMPRSAFSLGAVDIELDLGDIPAALQRAACGTGGAQ